MPNLKTEISFSQHARLGFTFKHQNKKEVTSIHEIQENPEKHARSKNKEIPKGLQCTMIP